ncbi:MAG: hypothetical protein IT356_12755 [Gemmatimonadaceae bacterium]|nr:hypothetical protein [Gemmatimonadaceae bacterium]
MNTYDHIQSRVFANDPDYDKLTGYVTDQYAREWTDSSGTRWRKVTTVINLGKADRVRPVDPDEAMQPDHTFRERFAPAAAMAGKQRAKAQRSALLVEKITAAFAEHGPMCAYDVAVIVGVAGATALNVLRAHREQFEFFGGKAARWGLPGQTITPTPLRSERGHE